MKKIILSIILIFLIFKSTSFVLCEQDKVIKRYTALGDGRIAYYINSVGQSIEEFKDRNYYSSGTSFTTIGKFENGYFISKVYRFRVRKELDILSPQELLLFVSDIKENATAEDVSKILISEKPSMLGKIGRIKNLDKKSVCWDEIYDLYIQYGFLNQYENIESSGWTFQYSPTVVTVTNGVFSNGWLTDGTVRKTYESGHVTTQDRVKSKDQRMMINGSYVKKRLLTSDVILETESGLCYKFKENNFLIQLSRNEIAQLKKWQNLVAKNVINNTDAKIRNAAVEKFKSQQTLALIVNYAEHYDVRKNALFKIKDQKIIQEIAIEAGDSSIRFLAVKKVENQEIIVKIVQKDIDAEVRKAALDKLDSNIHQELLSAVTKNDKDPEVRKTALNKLDSDSHQQLFTEVAKNDKDAEVREAALDKLDSSSHQEVFADIFKNDIAYTVSNTALKKLEDQKLLENIVSNAENSMIRVRAIVKLENQEIIAKFARNDKDAEVRVAALDKLDSSSHQDLLAEIFIQDYYNKVGKEALKKLTDERLAQTIIFDREGYVSWTLSRIKDINLLKTVAKKARNKGTRKLAKKKLIELENK